MLFPQKGLYAITQTEHKSPAQILDEVSAALRGGIAVLQYRDKRPGRDKTGLSKELLALCRAHNIPLVINDDVELAAKIGADGVHLGQDDGKVVAAKAHLGNQAIIGASCYNSVARAVEMQQQGVTYVAFGRFYPSSSKPLAAQASLETLQQARLALNIPIVAIGGILPSNGVRLLQAGADMLAVIGGLFDGDPEQRVKDYNALFL